MTVNGVFVYIRYRWGWLTVSLGYVRTIGQNADFEQQIGDEYAGVMDTNTMLSYTGLRLITGVTCTE